MELNNNIATLGFDGSFAENERLPQCFTVLFHQVSEENGGSVRVTWDDYQVGDIVNDNSHEEDHYRFHDVFHFTFATLLGWSPCTRSMMRRKRKSDPVTDEIEDGARAAITEEAISLVVFNEAKRKDFFIDEKKVNPQILRFIQGMVKPFEVRVRSEEDWEIAIIEGYRLFRLLVENNGGRIKFDSVNKRIEFLGEAA